MSVRKSAGAGSFMSYMQDVMRHLWRLLYDQNCLLSSSLFAKVSHLRGSRSPNVDNRPVGDFSVGKVCRKIAIPILSIRWSRGLPPAFAST